MISGSYSDKKYRDLAYTLVAWLSGNELVSISVVTIRRSSSPVSIWLQGVVVPERGGVPFRQIFLSTGTALR